MSAPCLIRLDKAIAETSNELERAYLLAEKACYLTRIGDHSSASEIRDELRQDFGDGRDLKASVLVMVLEGLQSYFQSLGGDAKDRLTRAQFLSKAAGHSELTALTSAWLGHVQFNEGNLLAAVESVKLATETIKAGQWAALVRISLVVADVFMAVGNLSSSKRWYSHARHAAVTYGDQAAIGAITYNQAALRVYELRLRSALGLPINVETLQLADAESRSAANYQHSTGATSLEHLLISVKVGLDMLLERHESALDLLSDLLVAGEIPHDYPYRAVLQADAVLCCTSLNRSVEAEQHLNGLLKSNLHDLPLDDQIILFSTLNRAAKNNPDAFESSYSEVDIEALGDRLSAQNAAVMPALAFFDDIPQSLRW